MKAYVFNITISYKMLCQNQHLWGNRLKLYILSQYQMCLHALTHIRSKC